MKNFAILSFLLVICSTAFAQGKFTVIGKVSKASDKKSMEGVAIYVESDDKERPDSRTDKYGIFSVDSVSINQELIFKEPEFNTERVFITSETEVLEVYMTPVIDEVHPFSTKLSTAGKSPQEIADIPASIVLISKEEISNLGYTSVQDILLNIPGLYGIEENEWTGQGPIFGVRGFYSPGMNNNLIIMINGVNQLEDYWGFYPLSKLEVPIEAIERIEVIRGPMSVVYGSGAFFGAINIITLNDPRKSNETSALLGSASAAYGIDGDYRANAFVKGGTRQGYYSFTLGANYSPGLNQDFSAMLDPNKSELTSDIKNSRGLFQDFRTYLGFSGRFTNMYFNLNLAQADKEMFIRIDNPNLDPNGKDIVNLSIPSGNGNVAHLLGGNAQIGYNNSFLQDKFSLDAKAGLFSHRSFMDYISSGNSNGIATFSSNAFEAELNGIWSIVPEKIELTSSLYFRTAFGLITTFDFGDVNLFKSKGNQNKNNYGVMLNGLYEVNDKLEIIAGARIEYIPDYTIVKNEGEMETAAQTFESTPVFLPRAAIIFKPNENHIFKGLFGVASKQPSFGNHTDVVGNPFVDNSSLKTSSINTLEGNYISIFQNRNKSKTLTTNFSLFYNILEELIYRATGVDAGFISKNTGKVNTYGTEFNSKLDIRNAKTNKQKLSIGLSITYQKSNLDRSYINKADFVNINVGTNAVETAMITEYPNSTGKIRHLSFSPSILGYLSIQYKLMDQLTLGLKSRYVGSMYSEFDTQYDIDLRETAGTVEDVKGYLAGDRYEGTETDAYLLFDINLAYRDILKTAKGSFDVSFKIQNALDTEYHQPITLNNPWVTKGFLGRGRWGMLTIEYNFKQ